jgi:hypothetical protein
LTRYARITLAPPQLAWDRLYEILIIAFQVDCAHPSSAAAYPSFSEKRALPLLGVEARVELQPLGLSRRTIRVDLVRSMRAKIVAQEIDNERSWTNSIEPPREHLADPFTLVMPVGDRRN